MVVGIGIDLVEIGRIERAMRNPRFVAKILTAAERRVCVTPQKVAGRWAAKEAVAKALGVPLSWHEVEILPGPMGQPMVEIASRHYDRRRFRINVSITHERTHAAAVAVLERLIIHAR